MACARVLLFNDDITTMEFVVQILEEFFGKTRDEALRLVLDIDCEGSGVCGVYALEQASNLAQKVTQLARLNGYPLRCVIESDDPNPPK